jgi:hypothetical protein
VRATLGALLICAVSLPLLSGCALYNRVFHHGGNDAATCHERPFAANTESRPTLTVPEGLSAPDTRNAVKIPTLNAAARPQSKSEPCLALPPKFFAAASTPAAKPAAPASPASPAPTQPVPAPGTTPAPPPSVAPPPVAPPSVAPPPAAPAAPAAPAIPPGTAPSGSAVPPG